MREAQMTVKNSKQIMIFMSPELLEKVEQFWRMNGFPNRSKGIINLIEKALREESEKEKGD
jgi:metal-responsive CopG/Arc/MetJ family transcriptional regulator